MRRNKEKTVSYTTVIGGLMNVNFLKCAFIISALFSLSSCASSNHSYNAGGLEIHDPLESVNRGVFAFNTAVDGAFIHPFIDGYRAVVPKPARSGLKNFLRNLKSPVHFVHQILQGDFDGAGDVLVRATVNTFVGVGGLFDVAGHEGIDYDPEDFGQTMAVWGVDHGPYLVVPFFGPTTMRDGTGFIVDTFADPVRLYLHNIDEEEWSYVRSGASYINLRDSLIDALRDLEASSIDYYAAVRSAYYQSRDAMVKDQATNPLSAAPQVTEEGYGWDDF